MKFILALIALLLSCDGTFTPSSVNTTSTSTSTSVPARPPRVDQRPDLWNIRGVTAFGAPLLEKPELLSFIHHVQNYGVNILRAGAQTDGWCGHRQIYLDECCGPELGTEAWRENLVRFLDVTSRIPGLYVQLIPTFTHKQNGYQQCLWITEQVIAIQQAGSEDDPRPYEHVVWEAVNEPNHPISRLTMRQVVRLLELLRETELAVGVDSGGGDAHPWEGHYPPEFLPYVDYIAFHPPRHVNGCTPARPGLARLRKVIGSYGLPVWLDETTGYISDESKALYGIGDQNGHYAACGGKTEKYRKRLTQEYMEDTEAAGGIWFTHAPWLFKCDRLGWLPS